MCRFKLFKWVFFFVLCLFAASTVQARHIVGGEITYKNLGRVGNANRYAFTMKVYRDCYGGGAAYDQPAKIAIYEGSFPAPVQVLDVRYQQPTNIPPPNLPCLSQPVNVCVEQAIYSFEVTLPISAQVYTVSYQRCCRNNTINNILNPELSGATFFAEITPFAQNNGNNSPEFRQFPPTSICLGEPLRFDHSATDIDGDQLVYEFCSPLLGGGDLNDGSCNGRLPDPPCGPTTFRPVNFRLPAYSSNAPMGGNPVVRIDPNTGLITGIPLVAGQFVVGVCVKEYRNGVLVGTTQRDFQFNVTACTPTVDARIRADSSNVATKTFLIRSCGSTNVAIENQSVDRATINNDFYWSFLIRGQEVRYNDWSPTVSFPDTGTYRGRLFLKKNSPCADSADLTVLVYPAVRPNFNYRYDTCVAGPVAFTDLSTSASGPIVRWRWTFGDGRDTTIQNPSHLYATPGIKDITLRATDTKGCTGDTTRAITWYPVPPFLLIEPSTFKGCTPANIFFNNLSTPIDTTYKIVWTFGDSTTSGAISPTHIYANPGVYNVSISVTSPIGCKISANYPRWITVLQGAKAGFTYTPEQPSIFNNNVQFTDQSRFASAWQWLFNGKGFTQRQNPLYTFRDTGIIAVRQIAINSNGCRDTLVKYLDIQPLITYFIPNAFTPNSDATNDYFKGKGYTEGMRDFELLVWDRYGEIIFQTKNPDEGWNGKKLQVGEDVQQGTYVFLVHYYTPRGKFEEIRGYVTLLR